MKHLILFEGVSRGVKDELTAHGIESEVCRIETGDKFGSLTQHGIPTLQRAIAANNAWGISTDVNLTLSVNDPKGLFVIAVVPFLAAQAQYAAELCAQAGIPFVIAFVSATVNEVYLPHDYRDWFIKEVGTIKTSGSFSFLNMN